MAKLLVSTEKRVQELKPILPESQALFDIEKEISIYEKGAAKDFTYQYFILKREIDS